MLDFSLLIKYAPILIQGIALTCSLALLGNGCSLVLGLLVALCRIGWVGENKWVSFALRLLAMAWIELFRNVPLLLQVLFYYYVFDLNGYWSTLLGLCTYTSAFMAETFRSGFLTVPDQEIRDGKILGLSRTQIFRHIYLPRSLENNLSALGSQVMNLTKNTSIAYFVTVGEMTYTFETLSGQTYHFVEFFLVAIATYASLCLLVAYIINRLEHWMLKRFAWVPRAGKSMKWTEGKQSESGGLIYGT